MAPQNRPWPQGASRAPPGHLVPSQATRRVVRLARSNGVQKFLLCTQRQARTSSASGSTSGGADGRADGAADGADGAALRRCSYRRSKAVTQPTGLPAQGAPSLCSHDACMPPACNPVPARTLRRACCPRSPSERIVHHPIPARWAGAATPRKLTRRRHSCCASMRCCAVRS